MKINENAVKVVHYQGQRYRVVLTENSKTGQLGALRFEELDAVGHWKYITNFEIVKKLFALL